MNTCLKAIGSVALAAGLMGCATIIHGTTQEIHFDSTPSGATASVGSQTVTTPGQLSLQRDRSYDVAFEKPGYLPAHTHVGQSASGAVWGNILLGGLIGLCVDYSNGAAYNLEPETVSATLVADPSAAPAPEAHTASESPPAAVAPH